jgi:D-alanyl-lipoteichoic acid acyltransferase DltB (MBOAT superfamily)
MLFDSLQFAAFFPIVCGLFWTLPQRFRWLLLLVSSYYFYMCWRPEYALVLVLITAIDFCVGIALARAKEPKARKVILLTSLAANLGILFFFKYYDFAARSLNSLTATVVVPELAMVLPIGLSFHTFQSMGYTVDVYRRKVEPERDWGTFATFIVFFPQLVAGPIERADDLLPQLRHYENFDYSRVTSGLKLMAWGLFKKMVIADRLARLVDPVYASPESQSGLMLALATVGFGYQIYCDFSGYSDIAIGTAEVLGVRLMMNFRAPYHSRSIREFWTRWHISLSTWFRDYVYIPLGGNRVSAGRWAFNILIVFFLSGIWHGANWTFFVWGLYHAALIIAGRVVQGFTHVLHGFGRREQRRHLPAVVGIVWTFLLVMAGWVFFRAPSIHVAMTIFQRMAADWQSFLIPARLVGHLSLIGWQNWDTIVICLALLALEIGDTVALRFSIRKWLAEQSTVVRWAAYYMLVLALIVGGQFNGPPFIYFQF